jgi:hypothetical protein
MCGKLTAAAWPGVATLSVADWPEAASLSAAAAWARADSRGGVAASWLGAASRCAAFWPLAFGTTVVATGWSVAQAVFHIRPQKWVVLILIVSPNSPLIHHCNTPDQPELTLFLSLLMVFVMHHEEEGKKKMDRLAGGLAPSFPKR